MPRQTTRTGAREVLSPLQRSKWAWITVCGVVFVSLCVSRDPFLRIAEAVALAIAACFTAMTWHQEIFSQQRRMPGIQAIAVNVLMLVLLILSILVGGETQELWMLILFPLHAYLLLVTVPRAYGLLGFSGRGRLFRISLLLLILSIALFLTSMVVPVTVVRGQRSLFYFGDGGIGFSSYFAPSPMARQYVILDQGPWLDVGASCEPKNRNIRRFLSSCIASWPICDVSSAPNLTPDSTDRQIQSTVFRIFMPTWLPVPVLICIVAACNWTRRRRARGMCPLCDYDLRGIVETRCPECGTCYANPACPE